MVAFNFMQRRFKKYIHMDVLKKSEYNKIFKIISNLIRNMSNQPKFNLINN